MNGETASPEGLDFKSEIAQSGDDAFQQHGFFWQKVHDCGPCKKLCGLCLLLAQRVEDDPFVRRVLVNQNKAVGSFQKNERVRKLADDIQAGIGKFRRARLGFRRFVFRLFRKVLQFLGYPVHTSPGMGVIEAGWGG